MSELNRYHTLPNDSDIRILETLRKAGLGKFVSVRRLMEAQGTQIGHRQFRILQEEGFIEYKEVPGPFTVNNGYPQDRSSYAITERGMRLARAVRKVVAILEEVE